MKRRICSLIMFGGIFVLSACQTTTEVGKGDIYFFRDSFVSAYKEYRASLQTYKGHDHAFVFNKEAFGWGWSSMRPANGLHAAITKATELCSGKSRNDQCRLFDVNGKIVWEGLNPDRKRELLAEASKVADLSDTKVVEFKRGRDRLEHRQKKGYLSYLKKAKDNDHSSYFISANGYSFGEAFMTGGNAPNAVQNGLRNCKSKSEYSDCFLFAVDGKPVNADASQALDAQ